MNWRDLNVSACRTHHECDGQPTYSGRFDEVLKFHAPGLAPVKRGDEAWHVDPDRGGREALFPAILIDRPLGLLFR